MAKPQKIVVTLLTFKTLPTKASLADPNRIMVELGRAVFALLMLAAPILLADDLDEFEAMMAEPAERRGWIDPMDMGLDSSGVGQSCDLGAVGKELQVCKEALRRALERNETTSKPVQVWQEIKS